MEYQEELYGNIYDKGEVIFRQGDHGDTIYVIQNGAVEVIRRIDDKNTVLSILEKGDFFGEMALIDDQPRSATVSTLCRSRLLALTRGSLLRRIMKDPGVALHLMDTVSRRIEKSNLLLYKSVEYSETSSASGITSNGKISDPEEIKAEQDKLNDLRNAFMDNLTDITGLKEQRQFRSGEIIFNQDESGNEMYIIAEGLVEIIHNAFEYQHVLAYLGPGDFFGEISLITNRPRTASAITREDTRLLVLSRRDLFEGLSKKPELGLLILQLMVVRLRKTILDIADPFKSINMKPRYSPSLSKKGDKISINFVSLSASHQPASN